MASPAQIRANRKNAQKSTGPRTEEGKARVSQNAVTHERIVLRDFSNSRVLDHLLMYERRIESSLYKAMTELHKLRLMHRLDPPTAKPTPNPVERQHPDLSCRAERSGLETSCCGHGAPAMCSEISPLRPIRLRSGRDSLASGRDDNRSGEDYDKQSQSATG